MTPRDRFFMTLEQLGRPGIIRGRECHGGGLGQCSGMTPEAAIN